MEPALKDKLLHHFWLRRLVRRVFATGDTVRRVVQKPLVDAFLPAAGNRVLDVGAGRGMYTFDSLQSRFAQVVGVEIREDHIAYLSAYKRRFGLNNVFFVRASAEALPFKSGVYDTVLCTEVIEHLQDDQEGIQELARMMQDHGTLVLSVPVPPAPRVDGEHVHEGYTFEQLQKLFNNASLFMERKDYCLLIISRGVLHVIAFFETKLGFPPPVLFLCYMERWLLRFRKTDLKPYDLIVRGIKGQSYYDQHHS